MSDPWVVRAGRWLAKRRSVILAPLFTIALLTARTTSSYPVELLRDLLGLACIIGGTRLRLVAASYHEGGHETGPITAGPYAWIRHPLYLANFLLGLGIILIAGWWPMTVAYLVVFLPVHAVIMCSEETHLTRLYGRQYEDYRRAVPGIFPWRRYRGPREGRRSGRKIRQGREYLKVLGYAAGIFALLLFKRWRQTVVIPTLPHWGIGHNLFFSGLALGAIILRPKVRSKWLRACQTVIAVASAALVVLHLPVAWGSTRPRF